jgi:DNA-binding NarL/FixJ family response regulator
MSAMLHVVPSPSALENRRRIAVVDDHAFMRDLIARELTRNDRHYEVVAAVGTAADAVAVCRRLKPDLLVLDIDLPDRTGVAAVPQVRRASPATRILLCTAYPKEDWFGEATSSGADGFVEKTNTWDDFLVAVDRVSRGQRYFCSNTVERATKQKTPDVRLTAREHEVLKLIAGGMTTKEIAARLFISIPTVETHRANLMGKTSARNVAGLVRFAIDAGVC